MSKPCPNCGEAIEASLFLGTAGRPSLLTEKLLGAVCDHIRNGATKEVACAAEGIDDRTLRKWRMWGGAGSQHHAAEYYAELDPAIARAEAQFETHTLSRLATLDASYEAFDRDGNPMVVNKIDPKIAAALAKSLTWLLERLRRERYGTLVTVKVEQAKQEMVGALVPMLEKHGVNPEAFLGELVAQLDGEGAPAN